jgi:hypothetical protein
MLRRLTELDALRGLMLVWMTLTHLPTIASAVINQPLGFVSASEGFISLSALFTGRIYMRLAERQGYPAVHRRLGMRTLRLYGYHALLLFFAFVIAANVALRGHRPGLYNLLDFYFAAGPRRALVDGLLLIYRPPLLDIIPLYIIFLLLALALLTLSARIGWKAILVNSFGVWLLAQFGLRQAVYALLNHRFGLSVPLNEMGAFDLWAWQLLWVVGLSCGARWAKDDLPLEAWAKRLTMPALAVAPALLILKYALRFGFDLGSFAPAFDKWHLGAVRLLDFAAIAVLLIRFQSALKPLAVRPLVLLGQASLQVFCAHFLFCFVGLAVMGDAERLMGWRQAALIVVTFAGLLWTAKIFGKSETKAEAKRPAESVIVPRSLPTEPEPAGREAA